MAAMRISHGVLPFRDRLDAGRRLGAALDGERADDAVVVGLARGGVTVAAEVARALEAPLDALAVRKVGHPFEPEYGIGAVTPGGGTFVRAHDGLTDTQVEAAVRASQARAEDLDQRLHARRPALDVAGKSCLLVDDGLATGATMIAACRWARAQKARRVVVAVPVGAPETVARVREEADAVVCLEVLEDLGAVGLWYADFHPVSDEEVLALLDESATGGATAAAVSIPADGIELPGDLTVPAAAVGAVIFAHGSGSSRLSPRNRLVARTLNEAGLATLLFDLLSEEESLDRANVFDIELLAARLAAADRWLRARPEGERLRIGYFGASTGAAAALWAAADLGDAVGAVVSRGGRPDLAAPRLAVVRAPTLLIVGGYDHVVLELNREAAAQLTCDHELVVVPGATHLFEEPGTLESVAEHATRWFQHNLASEGGA
jgi:putative phosphoribosyl transferase